MRRGLASLVVGISFALASLAWAAFGLSNSTLSPDASDELASSLVEHPVVNGALVGRTADALARQLPRDLPLSRQDLEMTAEELLETSAAKQAVSAAIATAHSEALAGVGEPVVANTAELNAAARSALVQGRPLLDEALPANPAVRVRLPTTGLSVLEGRQGLMKRLGVLAFVAAFIGLATSAVMATDRVGVLGRSAMTVMGIAAGWIALGYGFPLAIRLGAPGSMSLLAALFDNFVVSLVRPAIGLGIFGAIMLLSSKLWPSVSRRAGAAALFPSNPAPQSASDALMPTPVAAVLSLPPNDPVANLSIVKNEHVDEEPVTHDVIAEFTPQIEVDQEIVDRHPSNPSFQEKTASWLEGQGYLDDDRVAPFFRPS